MHTARLNHRTPFLGRVDVVPHAGVTSLQAWGQDVSETGMFLQTTQPFAVGDSVSIRFEVDGLEVHVRAATVVWVRRFEPVAVDGKSPGIGLRFVSIDPPARAALRRLTSVKVANEDSVLPAPTMTLPPLSRSIIQAAGGRDLDDTQDLLPPSSLPRSTGEAISLPPMQFTMPPVTIAPTLVPAASRADDVNLTSESRVFAGVPDAPRPITMLPRLRSLPPTKAPVMSMTTSIVQPSAVLNSHPPVNAAITQPMHSLPPVDAVDVFAGWTFAKVESTAPVASAIDEDAVTTPPMAVDAVTAEQLQARFSSELQDELDDDSAPENATILNPSILEAQTVPPSVISDSAVDEFFTERAHDGSDDSLGIGTVDDSGAYSLGAVVASTPPTPSVVREVSMADERRSDRGDRRTPKPQASKPSSSRRSMQVAAVLLVAGCAAGGAVGVLSRAARSKPTTTSATTVAAVAPEAPAVMNVADAEAELFGKKPKAATAPTSPMPKPVVDEVPAAAVAVVPVEAPKVEAKVEPVKVAEAPQAVAPKAAPKAEASLTSTTKVEKKKPPLVTKPGRLEVDLPEGGHVKKVFALAAPARVVVDFDSAKLPAKTVELGEAGALELRFGKPDASTQRVVIVLDGDNKPDAVEARLEGDRLIATWDR